MSLKYQALDPNYGTKTISRGFAVDEINCKTDLPFLTSLFIRLPGISALGARYRSFNSLHNWNLPVSIRQSFPHNLNILFTESSSYLISNFNNPDAIQRTTWYDVIFFNSSPPSNSSSCFQEHECKVTISLTVDGVLIPGPIASNRL